MEPASLEDLSRADVQGAESFAYDCARVQASAAEWRAQGLGGVLLKTADRALCGADRKGAKGTGAVLRRMAKQIVKG